MTMHKYERDRVMNTNTAAAALIDCCVLCVVCMAAVPIQCAQGTNTNTAAALFFGCCVDCRVFSRAQIRIRPRPYC